MKFSEQLKAGVILDNPIFMQTIGLCPDTGHFDLAVQRHRHGRCGDRRTDLLQRRYFRAAQVYSG